MMKFSLAKLLQADAEFAGIELIQEVVVREIQVLLSDRSGRPKDTLAEIQAGKAIAGAFFVVTEHSGPSFRDRWINRVEERVE